MYLSSINNNISNDDFQITYICFSILKLTRIRNKMASEDVIELVSSDDEVEPAPKRVPYFYIFFIVFIDMKRTICRVRLIVGAVNIINVMCVISNIDFLYCFRKRPFQMPWFKFRQTYMVLL